MASEITEILGFYLNSDQKQQIIKKSFKDNPDHPFYFLLANGAAVHFLKTAIANPVVLTGFKNDGSGGTIADYAELVKWNIGLYFLFFLRKQREFMSVVLMQPFHQAVHQEEVRQQVQKQHYFVYPKLILEAK